MGMLFYMILIVLLAFILYRRNKPLKYLTSIDAETLLARINNETAPIILLDVRDQLDYYKDHLEGSMNISLGRLPYVKKEFGLQDELILISDSERDSRKAAKILAKQGFPKLTHLVGGMCAVRKVKQSKPVKRTCA